MLILNIILAVLAVFGLYHFGKGLRRLKRRQRIRGGAQTSGSAAFLAVTALTWGISSHLYTYQRLNHEQDVAEVSFNQIAPQQYKAEIRFPDGKQSNLEIHGDEWQISARVLKWESIGNIVGLNSMYRLDRLKGQYTDIQQDRELPHSVYQLTPEAGVDLWRIARQYAWVPFVDAIYGSAAYMPMTDNSRYQIRLTQSGLIVRPINKPAEDAVKTWN